MKSQWSMLCPWQILLILSHGVPMSQAQTVIKKIVQAESPGYIQMARWTIYFSSLATEPNTHI